jgi:PAS domain S-box-containing protein
VGGVDRPLIVAAVRDNTERQAAGALAAQLAAIVRGSADGIISVSIEGRVSSWNPGAEGLFGYTADEMRNEHISILVPEDATEVEDLFSGVLAGTPLGARDTKWRRRDGSLLDVALSASPLQDEAGRLLGISLLARDITERKLQEIELQRLLADEHRNQQYQAATAEIRLSLLSGAPLAESRQLVCRRACELLQADAAVLVSGTESRLEIVAVAGRVDEPRLIGMELVTDASLAGRVVSAGGAVRLPRLQGEIDTSRYGEIPEGPAVGAPARNERGIVGAFVVVRELGAPEFTDQEVAVVQGFADQAALASEMARAREAAERVLLADDRDRIARDLHDLVIQRLFATGMSLQGVLRLIADTRVSERVLTAIDDLDTTIREIRTAIFSLETPTGASTGFRAEVLQLAARAAEGLGFEPAVHFEGPVDNAVPTELAPQVFAVLREALSNVARHARATKVEVVIAAGNALSVTVEDNGVGIGDPSRSSGLANLRQRAQSFGGDLEIASRAEGGTRLLWHVSLGG